MMKTCARLFITLAVLCVGHISGYAAHPNVVMIISDDQGWFDFGFMGSKDISTPNLDRLASESAVFTRGYVPASLCRPSLATMLTGLYPHQHQCGTGTKNTFSSDKVNQHWCVTGRWKLIVSRVTDAATEFYDVVSDPHEKRNVSADHPELVTALARRTDEWWSAQPSF